MILLDTDHCIFFIRGWQPIVSAFTAHSSDEPAISIITVGELYFGAFRSARRQENLDRCHAFIDRVRVIGLTEAAMMHFASLKAELAEKGEILEDPDLLMAATALEHEATFVTHNQAHFLRIPGLKCEDWYSYNAS
jgi:tRNA(fMet)-specific endonuclease VapC